MIERHQYYLLDSDHRPVAVTAMAWAQAFESVQNRHVAATEFECGVFVSTVFLGIDHRFMGNGPPLLFETMAFGMKESCEMEESFAARYSSWDDAVTGHAATVRRVKEVLVKARVSTKLKQGEHHVD